MLQVETELQQKLIEVNLIVWWEDFHWDKIVLKKLLTLKYVFLPQNASVKKEGNLNFNSLQCVNQAYHSKTPFLQRGVKVIMVCKDSSEKPGKKDWYILA